MLLVCFSKERLKKRSLFCSCTCTGIHVMYNVTIGSYDQEIHVCNTLCIEAILSEKYVNFAVLLRGTFPAKIVGCPYSRYILH